MRLICPNCDAEYEVDAAAIPDQGRDVQCSACGHAWFQMPPDVLAAAEEERDLYDAPPVPAASAGAAAAPVRAMHAEDEDLEDGDAPEADLTLPAAPPAPAAGSADPVDDAPAGPKLGGRSLDESLLAVLREEAEREAAARRAESVGIEMQEEFPLSGAAPSVPPTAPSQPAAPQPAASPAVPPEVAAAGAATAALRKLAKLRGETVPPGAAAAKEGPSRRDLLPEIEEINSTLRAAGEKREVDQGAVADTLDGPARRRGGFGNGFLSVVLIVLLAALVYVLAPLIAQKVPALAGALTAYVAAIDALRGTLDSAARAITARLSGFASQG